MSRLKTSMKKRLQHEITSWVAIVIIAAFGTFFVYFIWASANESWGYDYVYPSFNKRVNKLITQVETIGWKTYKDDGYGFEVRHPARFSPTVSNIVSSSILGSIGGTSVGPLVFIKADTANLKQIANSKFNYYWNYAGQSESPSNYCTKGAVSHTGIEVRIASCSVGAKNTNYAHIKGKTFDVFVDGSTSGYDKKLIDTYGQAGSAVSKDEFIQIMSTFEFVN